MPIETYTHTVQDVINYVTRQFGDEAAIQIDTSDIIRWINDGQREITNTATTINEAVATTNIVNGTDSYPIASDPAFVNMQNIHTVLYDGVPMQNMSFAQAMGYIGKSDASNGVTNPSIWYLRGGILTLWPKPSKDIASGLRIYYTKAAPRITAVGDMLGIPDNYYNALVQYVMQQAYEMDENFQAAQAKNAQFEKSVNSQANQTVTQQSEFMVIQSDPEDWM